jgi:DNA-binding transcriptional MocR family regulator
VTIWTPNLDGRTGPKYLALADALSEDVLSGHLAHGTRLPTHRELAERLGVTVGTVSRAYAEAERRGFVSGEVGRGTFARGPLADAAPAAVSRGASTAVALDDEIAELSLNVPPRDHRGDALAATLQALARDPGTAELMEYPPDGGHARHRAAGALWITRSGYPVSANDVYVVNGCQHGMAAAFHALLKPGDVMLTEEVTYPGLKAVAAAFHLRLHGVAMDAEGLRPDALEAACAEKQPRAIYCVPTLQNPTTATMSKRRRLEVAEIARRHGAVIVEDDVHGRLLPEPPAPIAALAPDVTCYVTSTSKGLAPGLRIGFLVPPAPLAHRFAELVRTSTWMAAPLMAEIAARWLTDGTAEKLLAAKRAEVAARQQRAAAAFAGLRYAASPASFHLWLQLPEPWRADAVVAHASRRGVRLTPTEAFVVGRAPTPHAIRLCLGAARDRDQLDRALRVIAEILEGPADASSVVA